MQAKRAKRAKSRSYLEFRRENWYIYILIFIHLRAREFERKTKTISKTIENLLASLT